MLDVPEILVAFLKNQDYLPRSRLVNLVYLADWKHAFEYRSQISPCTWYSTRLYEPPEITEALKRTDLFEIVNDKVPFYVPIQRVHLIHRKRPSIEGTQAMVIEHTCKTDDKLTSDEMIRLVYSTWPWLARSHDSPLDLVELGREYTAVMQPKVEGRKL